MGLFFKIPTNSESSNAIYKVDKIDSQEISNKITDRRISTSSILSLDETVYSNEIISIKDGKYEYEDSVNCLIGRGSFGHVFKGLDRRKMNKVAVKRLTRLNVKPDELKAIKQVRDKNLVAFIDICDDGFDMTYFIMEYCDTDLEKHLRFKAINGKLNKIEMK